VSPSAEKLGVLILGSYRVNAATFTRHLRTHTVLGPVQKEDRTTIRDLARTLNEPDRGTANTLMRTTTILITATTSNK
jgi:hypothetical protein